MWHVTKWNLKTNITPPYLTCKNDRDFSFPLLSCSQIHNEKSTQKNIHDDKLFLQMGWLGRRPSDSGPSGPSKRAFHLLPPLSPTTPPLHIFSPPPTPPRLASSPPLAAATAAAEAWLIAARVPDGRGLHPRELPALQGSGSSSSSAD